MQIRRDPSSACLLGSWASSWDFGSRALSDKDFGVLRSCFFLDVFSIQCLSHKVLPDCGLRHALSIALGYLCAVPCVAHSRPICPSVFRWRPTNSAKRSYDPGMRDGGGVVAEAPVHGNVEDYHIPDVRVSGLVAGFPCTDSGLHSQN